MPHQLKFKAPLQKWTCCEIHWVRNCFQFIIIRSCTKKSTLSTLCNTGKLKWTNLAYTPDRHSFGFTTPLANDCVVVFFHRHDLHVIMDEIYGLSVWDQNSSFHSVLSLKDIPDPNKTHFVWSFSKVSKPSLIQIKLILYGASAR